MFASHGGRPGADAESLLLVNHHQPKVLEHGIGRQQPVCAHDDIDAAVLEARDHLSLLSSCEEPRQHLDTDRVRRETVLKIRKVLLGKECRWDQHGCLLAPWTALNIARIATSVFP